MMRSFPLFLFASAFVVGCGAAPQPRPASPATHATPAPVPSPPAVQPGPATPPQASPAPTKKPNGFAFVLPKGWHQDANAPHGVIAVVNETEQAKVAFALVPASKEGRLRSVRDFRREIMRRSQIEDGDVIEPAGIVIWSYRRQNADGQVMQGSALAKASNMPGYGIMLMAVWPYALNKKLIPQFLLMAKTVQLR